MFDAVEGIALILPIDHFCDMFSATNVLGNALATSVVRDNGKVMRR
jgi:Na+/H+-dicarboxylate symporter